jgi:O-methyltransferase involved in polyketide biosynthesis
MQRKTLTLDPVEETLLLTLYLKALDSKLPVPMLGDTLSAELVDQIEYDFTKLKVNQSLVYSTGLRTKRLDDAVRAFIAEHPDAVVLDLGCGLDPRMSRCDPPATVDWYDIDFPVVADLRPGFLPGRSHPIGADFTTHPLWLEDLPRDRPAMIVAEGLAPFLPGGSFPALTRALTTHFGSGELAFNGYTRFASWAMKYTPVIKAIGVTAAPGFDDPREPETWDAGLRLVEEQFITRAPEVADFPPALRTVTRLMARSSALARQGARILRYRF